MNSDDIYIVIDSSGSFTECGKKYLQMYMVDSIANAVENKTIDTNNSFKYFLWNETVVPYELFSGIKFTGGSDIEKLKEFLLNLEENSIVFLLSDGNFDINVDILSQELKEKKVMLFTFAVGADSDENTLEHLSTDCRSYEPDSIIVTIKNILMENS